MFRKAIGVSHQYALRFVLSPAAIRTQMHFAGLAWRRSTERLYGSLNAAIGCDIKGACPLATANTPRLYIFNIISQSGDTHFQRSAHYPHNVHAFRGTSLNTIFCTDVPWNVSKSISQTA